MRHRDKQDRYDLTGWILFVICALLFLYTAIRDRDIVTGVASIVFLTGCVAFLIPLIFPNDLRKKKTGNAPGMGD